MQRRNPQTVVEAVGRRIAEVRQHHALTQEEAAERLGISLRHMKRIEAGHNMTLFTLARIAFAFDVAPASLLAPPRSSGHVTMSRRSVASVPRLRNPWKTTVLLDPKIYLAESGFDDDLALLIEVLQLLDMQLTKIADQGDDPDRDDFSNLWERAEHVIGLGFVACQTYMAARSGWASRKKKDMLDRGPLHACGLRVARIVNAAADYWKHAPEADWLSCPGNTLRPGTLEPLTAVGVSGSDFIVSQALDHLVGTERTERLTRLVPMLVTWRRAVDGVEEFDALRF